MFECKYLSGTTSKCLLKRQEEGGRKKSDREGEKKGDGMGRDSAGTVIRPKTTRYKYIEKQTIIKEAASVEMNLGTLKTSNMSSNTTNAYVCLHLFQLYVS